MGASNHLLTTKEFASRSGLPTSKVTKLLRDGRIKGQKQAGKWMIPESELDAAAAPQAPSKPVPARKSPTAAAAPSAPGARSGQTYSVAEFSAMTYLTEKGVRDWLTKGNLSGAPAEGGDWRIDAASLENPNVKRLLR